MPHYVEEFRFDECNYRIVVPLDCSPALGCGRSAVLRPTGVVVLVGEVDAPDSVCEIGRVEKRRNSRFSTFDVAYLGGIRMGATSALQGWSFARLRVDRRLGLFRVRQQDWKTGMPLSSTCRDRLARGQGYHG